MIVRAKTDNTCPWVLTTPQTLTPTRSSWWQSETTGHSNLSLVWSQTSQLKWLHIQLSRIGLFNWNWANTPVCSTRGICSSLRISSVRLTTRWSFSASRQWSIESESWIVWTQWLTLRLQIVRRSKVLFTLSYKLQAKKVYKTLYRFWIKAGSLPFQFTPFWPFSQHLQKNFDSH